MRDAGHFSHAPEIEFSISRKNELIQVADLFVYNLYRSQRDAQELPMMQELINAIKKEVQRQQEHYTKTGRTVSEV